MDSKITNLYQQIDKLKKELDEFAKPTKKLVSRQDILEHMNDKLKGESTTTCVHCGLFAATDRVYCHRHGRLDGRCSVFINDRYCGKKLIGEYKYCIEDHLCYSCEGIRNIEYPLCRNCVIKQEKFCTYGDCMKERILWRSVCEDHAKS